MRRISIILLALAAVAAIGYLLFALRDIEPTEADLAAMHEQCMRANQPDDPAVCTCYVDGLGAGLTARQMTAVIRYQRGDVIGALVRIVRMSEAESAQLHALQAALVKRCGIVSTVGTD